MAIFHSSIGSLALSVKVNGYNRHLQFTPKGRPFNYGYLYVNDPDTVAVLKRHPEMNKTFWVHEDDAPVAKEEVTKSAPIKEYPEVTKTQEAKAILANEYNYDVENVRSKAAALAAAKELNIAFPNL